MHKEYCVRILLIKRLNEIFRQSILIRNINDIEKVFLYLCFNSSSIINLQTICKELQINRVTLEKYINYLESANLIYISHLVNIGPKYFLKSQNKIYISDAAIRNAVLLKDDITSVPVELGIVTETAVYKHIKSFSYKSLAEIGYYRGEDKEKEIDIVVNYHEGLKPIMIEVKYREDSKITEKDLIVEKSNSLYPNLVITKKMMILVYFIILIRISIRCPLLFFYINWGMLKVTNFNKNIQYF